MANYAYTDDLRSDALFRAGEPQTSSSPFWAQSLVYLNRVYQGLVLGGGFAVGRDLATSAGIYAHVVGLPITDWWWARRLGILTTSSAIQTGTVTLTQGSAALTFSSAPAQSVASWRLLVQGLPTVPRILTHQAGSTAAVLDDVWPEATQTAVGFTAFKNEYDLPADFLRFATPPYSHANFALSVPVASREQMDLEFPLASVIQGAPTRVYLGAGVRKLLTNNFDTRGYRLEFEYIADPVDLQAGGEPLLPLHHRPVLSVGAAMLMTFDKGDPRAANLASEYRELVTAMVQEHRRALSGGSSLYGVFKTRDRGRQFLRSAQPLGEVFLS